MTGYEDQSEVCDGMPPIWSNRTSIKPSTKTEIDQVWTRTTGFQLQHEYFPTAVSLLWSIKISKATYVRKLGSARR
jgi:hypothetical protein